MKQEKVNASELEKETYKRFKNEFVKDCDIMYGMSLKNKEEYYFYIRLKDHAGEISKIGFLYKPDKKRFEEIKYELGEYFSIYKGIFSNELENIAKYVGCNELRTFNKEVFEENGWIEFKYPDGSYRKNLHPWHN